MTVSRTAVLCALVFANTACLGTFSPLLPEIARAQALADWQLGVLGGAFGFARMLGDVPTGILAARRLGTTLAVAPLLLVAGVLLLASAGPFAVLVLGRALIGLGHTLTMVGGLTAILLDQAAAKNSIRLNAYEFAGMAGVLGGLTGVGVLPAAWGWPLTMVVASAPAFVAAAFAPWLRRWFPDREAGSAVGPRTAAVARLSLRMPPIVWLMFGMGIVMALAWSAMNQFLIPVRGAREFGLDRAGVSRLLAVCQVVDLCMLLPVGWLADRVGRMLMMSLVAAALALGAWSVGLGSFPLFVAGCVLLGFGMAGWMFPLAVIREYTSTHAFAWRTGLYRVGVDAAAFLGPLVCGLIGDAHTGVFVTLVGIASLAAALRLGWLALR